MLCRGQNFLDNAGDLRILGNTVPIRLLPDKGFFTARMGVDYVLKNVLDAIREGDWFFEPEEVQPHHFRPTSAIPGTREKLAVLAERARAGLPLWHESDRVDYETSAEV